VKNDHKFVYEFLKTAMVKVDISKEVLNARSIEKPLQAIKKELRQKPLPPP